MLNTSQLIKALNTHEADNNALRILMEDLIATQQNHIALLEQQRAERNARIYLQKEAANKEIDDRIAAVTSQLNLASSALLHLKGEEIDITRSNELLTLANHETLLVVPKKKKWFRNNGVSEEHARNVLNGDV